MKFYDYYNLLVTFSSLDDIKNADNFTIGLVKYFENVEIFIDIIKSIEIVTKLKATEIVKPSFKSSEVFNDKENKFAKFDIIKLQFPDGKFEDCCNKIKDLVKKDTYKNCIKLKTNKEKKLIFLYLTKEIERKIPINE